MKQFTESKTFKFSSKQMEAFRKLDDYGVNVSQFVRIAIAEKIKRDWKVIKEKKERVYLPF